MFCVIITIITSAQRIMHQREVFNSKSLSIYTRLFIFLKLAKKESYAKM